MENQEEKPNVLMFVPVHNEETEVRECLDSVCAQTYPNQIIVLSDNASTDNTVKIVEEEYPKVIIHRWDNYNVGANPGFTRAVKETNCEFVAQIAADDRLLPNYWETTLPYFKDPEVGIVSIGAIQATEQHPEGDYWKPRTMHHWTDIFISNRFFMTSPLRKEAFLDMANSEWGGVDLDNYFADWDLWIQVILSGWKWVECPAPLFKYNRRKSAWSWQNEARVEGYKRMLKRWFPLLIKYNIVYTTIAPIDVLMQLKQRYPDGRLP